MYVREGLRDRSLLAISHGAVKIGSLQEVQRLRCLTIPATAQGFSNRGHGLPPLLAIQAFRPTLQTGPKAPPLLELLHAGYRQCHHPRAVLPTGHLPQPEGIVRASRQHPSTIGANCH